MKNLPSNINVYNADTNQQITDLTIKVGMKIYFTSSDEKFNDGEKINISYSYDTTEFFYLSASDKKNQDLVGLETKNNNGNITLIVKDLISEKLL